LRGDNLTAGFILGKKKVFGWFWLGCFFGWVWIGYGLGMDIFFQICKKFFPSFSNNYMFF
jgi:hypothetical protein